MKLVVKPAKISGRLVAPPSKSHSMRAIIFASMAKGKSHLSNIIASPDTDAMIAGCQQLGAQITKNADQLQIIGCNGTPQIPDDVIDAGNSGQVLRFIACLAALSPAYTIITGDHSIRHQRPVLPLISGLPQLGAQCVSSKNDGFAPIIIHGSLHAGQVRVNGKDSQPVSGLIIASLFTEGLTEIFVDEPGELPWVDLTLSWLDFLNLSYERDGYSYYRIPGKQNVANFNYQVPGDFSSIAFPLAAALVTQSELIIENVDMSDIQGDKQVITVLQSLGAAIAYDEKQKLLRVNGQQRIRGGEIDVNDFIDAVPILTALSCYSSDTTVLKNAAIARMKESDRLSAITQELRKMGANIVEEPDSLTIHPAPLHGAVVQSHHDHRIAMSLAVAALQAKGETTIENVECIRKSYQDFVTHFQQLGAIMECSA